MRSSGTLIALVSWAIWFVSCQLQFYGKKWCVFLLLCRFLPKTLKKKVGIGQLPSSPINYRPKRVMYISDGKLTLSLNLASLMFLHVHFSKLIDSPSPLGHTRENTGDFSPGPIYSPQVGRHSLSFHNTKSQTFDMAPSCLLVVGC